MSTEEQYREIIRLLDDLSLDLRGDQKRGHLGVKGRLERLEVKATRQDRRIAAFSGVMGAIGAAVGFLGALLSGLVKDLFQ